MERPEAFQEDLNDLLELAQASDMKLTKREIMGALSDYSLDEKQIAMVEEYLAAHSVTVVGEGGEKEIASSVVPETILSDEEREKSERAHYRMYRTDLSGLEPFSKAKEKALLARLTEGDSSVANTIIEGRLRFAEKMAHLYEGQGLPLMDLIQEANLALVIAVSAYEEGNFEEQLITQIQSALEAALAEVGAESNMMTRLAGQINSLMIVTARLAEELGREATLPELAEKMKLPEDTVRELVRQAMDAMTIQEDEKVSDELK